MNNKPLPLGLPFDVLLATATKAFEQAVNEQIQVQDENTPRDAIIAGSMMAGVCKAIEANNRKMSEDFAGLQAALEALVGANRSSEFE